MLLLIGKVLLFTMDSISYAWGYIIKYLKLHTIGLKSTCTYLKKKKSMFVAFTEYKIKCKVKPP